MRRLGTILFLAIVITCLLGVSFAPSAALAAGEAKELTGRCTFSCSSNTSVSGRLSDGSHETVWTAGKASGQYVQIELPEDGNAAGVYVMWNEVPKKWSLLVSAGGSVWQDATLCGTERFINAYVPLDSGVAKLRIESASYDWKLSIAEIKVYGPGTLPPAVQVWQAPPDKADLMVITAHPDDEYIYFGGTLPLYTGQLKKHTTVVYMTSSPMIRKFEALDGLWAVGVREYPVFLPLKNEYSSEIDDAADIWGSTNAVTGLLAEQLRRFRPDVVVTHDLDGEYGHGAHKLTALAVQKAVDASGKAGKYPDSADHYGLWQVKKCYLHLYGKNGIKMDWRQPLDAFGGKTALQMAQAGYDRHVSQHFRERPVLDTGEYDNSAYGLYFTSVGPDTGLGDFFENVPAPTASAEPSPQPSPSASPSASPNATASPASDVPTPQSTPASSGAPRTGNPGTVVAVVIMMLAAAGLWVLADRKSTAAARHAKK